MPNDTESSLTKSQDDTSFVSLQDESCPSMPHCPTLTVSALSRALDRLQSDPSKPQATIRIREGFFHVLGTSAYERHQSTDPDFAEASAKYGINNSKGFDVANLILVEGSPSEDLELLHLNEVSKEFILAHCSKREIPSSIQMNSLCDDRGTYSHKVKEWELAQLPCKCSDGSATFRPLTFRHIISNPASLQIYASAPIEDGKSSEGL